MYDYIEYNTIYPICHYIPFITTVETGVFAPLNAREEAKKSILQKTAQ